MTKVIMGSFYLAPLCHFAQVCVTQDRRVDRLPDSQMTTDLCLAGADAKINGILKTKPPGTLILL